MRIYWASRNTSGNIVWIEDGNRVWPLSPKRSQALLNHSPDGFEWGYGGSGPAQLALAILLDCLGDEHLALKHHQDFKNHRIATASKDGFHLEESYIRSWLASTTEADA